MKSSQAFHQRESALSHLYARAADDHPDVRRFRKKALGDKFIEPESVSRWIQEKFENDRKAFRQVCSESRAAETLDVIADRTGVPTETLRAIKNLLAGSRLTPEKFALSLLKRSSPIGKSLVDAVTSEWSTAGPARNYVAFPDSTGKMTAILPTVKDGLLEELRYISTALAEKIGWSPAEATFFILTGRTPVYNLIKAGVTPSKIILEIDASVDAESVAEKYREIRRHYSLGHTRDKDGGKKLRMAEFVLLRANQGLSDRELFKKWNSMQVQKPTWQYENASDFNRDRKSALKKVSLDDHISPIRLLDENPYFKRVREPVKASGATVTLVALIRKGLSRATVWRLVENGSLPKPKLIGGKARWPADACNAFIESRKSQKTHLKSFRRRDCIDF